MTLYEMLAFNGTGSELEEYKALIGKRKKLEAMLRVLSNKIQAIEDSISVFEGELSDRDKKRLESHIRLRNEAVCKKQKTEEQWERVKARIKEMQV